MCWTYQPACREIVTFGQGNEIFAPVPGMEVPTRGRCASSGSRLSGNHHRCKSIVSLVPNGLNCGGGNSRVGSKCGHEATHTLNRRILGGSIHDSAPTYHVIGDDETASATQSDSPLKVVRVVSLIGINEDEVERLQLFSENAWKQIECRTHTLVDKGSEPSSLEVAPNSATSF
jgi:hypothetical protein